MDCKLQMIGLKVAWSERCMGPQDAWIASCMERQMKMHGLPKSNGLSCSGLQNVMGRCNGWQDADEWTVRYMV